MRVEANGRVRLDAAERKFVEHLHRNKYPQHSFSEVALRYVTEVINKKYGREWMAEYRRALSDYKP